MNSVPSVMCRTLVYYEIPLLQNVNDKLNNIHHVRYTKRLFCTRTRSLLVLVNGTRPLTIQNHNSIYTTYLFSQSPTLNITPSPVFLYQRFTRFLDAYLLPMCPNSIDLFSIVLLFISSKFPVIHASLTLYNPVKPHIQLGILVSANLIFISYLLFNAQRSDR